MAIQIWADLKKAANELSEEQLQRPIFMWGVESGCKLEMEVLEEDYLDDDEGCSPRSVMVESLDEGESIEDYEVIHTKGTVILSADKILTDVEELKPRGSAKTTFNNFWKTIKNDHCSRKTLASISFDAGHALRHKQEDK
jgi:hypothetical protein